MSAGAISDSGAAAYAAATAASSSATDASGGIVSIMKEAVALEGDMAMRLITANLQSTMQQEKMNIAAEIISQNQIDVYV